VEDVDNPWVEDHFKSTVLSKSCSFIEKTVIDETTGDTYVALATRGASILKTDDIHAYPGVPQERAVKFDKFVNRELHFVPYFFKANRGGRGHARVGLRRWREDL